MQLREGTRNIAENSDHLCIHEIYGLICTRTFLTQPEKDLGGIYPKDLELQQVTQVQIK